MEKSLQLLVYISLALSLQILSFLFEDGLKVITIQGTQWLGFEFDLFLSSGHKQETSPGAGQQLPKAL